jgi:cytochrome c
MIRILLTAGLVILAAPCTAQTTSSPTQSAEQATAAPAGDEAAGEEIYGTVCRTCHGGLIAPTLRGIAGRPIASTDFGHYSAGLRAKAGESWTDANLDAFLRAPAEFAPGTEMSASVPEAQARADVIAFLKTLPPPR